MTKCIFSLEAALRSLIPSPLDIVLNHFRAMDKSAFPQTFAGLARAGVSAGLIESLKTLSKEKSVRECVMVSAAVDAVFSLAEESYAAKSQVDRYLRQWLRGDASVRSAVAEAVAGEYGTQLPARSRTKTRPIMPAGGRISVRVCSELPLS